eukprot:gene24784-biopygen19452
MAPTVVYKKRYLQFPPADLLEHPAGGKMCFWGVVVARHWKRTCAGTATTPAKTFKVRSNGSKGPLKGGEHVREQQRHRRKHSRFAATGARYPLKGGPVGASGPGRPTCWRGRGSQWRKRLSMHKAALRQMHSTRGWRRRTGCKRWPFGSQKNGIQIRDGIAWSRSNPRVTRISNEPSGGGDMGAETQEADRHFQASGHQAGGQADSEAPTGIMAAALLLRAPGTQWGAGSG